MSDEPNVWFKSSYSGGANTECVEAAHLAQGIAIRDSKNPDGPILRFPAPAWAAFLDAVRRDTLR
jgi:hypothetical protein